MAITDQDTALRETSSKERSRPPSRSRRMAFAWAGVLAAGATVAALALTTFTADDDEDMRARWFAPEAEQYERQAHLEGQARTYGNAPATDGTAAGQP